MPIYEYECTKCGERIEVIRKMSDPPLKRCRACSGKLQRLLSPVGIQFKGSGWYVTDYARKSGDREPKSSDKKAESKPEPKKETKSE
jgi:putative FmdB family regulatory protein